MKRLALILFLFVAGCGIPPWPVAPPPNAYQWANSKLTMRAVPAAARLCAAQDLHQMLQGYAMSPGVLEKFCTQFGSPLELNEAWEHGG